MFATCPTILAFFCFRFEPKTGLVRQTIRNWTAFPAKTAILVSTPTKIDLEEPVAGPTQEAVVLIHGLCGHPLVMLPLARRLRQAGYMVINWGYRSTWNDIATHAERLRRTLIDLDDNPDISSLHVVAHSMGCIVARQALLQGRPKKFGRVVMICPPNSGSHAATRIATVLGRLCKTVVEIADLPESWVNRLPKTLPLEVPVGIIAASGDWVVSLASTNLPGAAHCLVISGMHSSILIKKATAEATIQFLRKGTF